nr:HAMP domain-containing histidine kinase [Bradyrhizobium sp. 1(2017)]
MHRAPSYDESTGGPAAADLQRAKSGLDGCDFEAVLLAIAGHDLRQPLQILQSVHDRFGREARTQSELRLLRAGQSAIDQLRYQLDQLLGALRLRERAGSIQPSPIALGPLLQKVWLESECAALQKGVQIRLVHTTAWIISDVFLLGAIVRNLVSNAIRYTEPGGRVLLGCRQHGCLVRIDVVDTGVGISAEQMPEIFEAFARFDSAQRDGLGIGLFIVRQATAMLGHRVDVSSVLSRGTRFSILARSSRCSRPA